MPSPKFVLLTLVAASALASVGSPAAATANEFPINACQADRANFSTQAFEDFATRGMMWKRACNPLGSGLRGLVTANVVRPGRVPRGARSYFVMKAPEGTRFSRVSWSGHARRSDCRYALQVWASRPDGAPVPIKNVRANRGCPPRSLIQTAGWPRARTYKIPGATSIVQRIVCVGKPGDPHCSSRGRNFIRTFKAQATVVDVSPPGVSIAQDNPFTRGEWVGGAQTVSYGALDNTGVRLVRPIFNGTAYGDTSQACDYSLRVPCTNGTGSVAIDTRRLGDGSQSLVLEARDAADNSGLSPGLTVRVDNTPPGAVHVAAEGGEAWRNDNNFDLTWVNPAEGDRAPIAGAHYRLCRTSGADCANGSVSGAGINQLANLALPGAGEWQVRVWRQDAAGNSEPANASVPVTLRFDPESPELGFEPQPASDPTQISVLVTDNVSGLASGQIELSREGSGVWQTLPTQMQGSRLLARIDDASLPAGNYLLRASARDQAANQNSSDRRLDGSPMVLSLPLRVQTAIRAGVVSKRTVRRTIRRRGKRRLVRRRVATLEQSAKVRFGQSVTIDGRLENRAGQPVPGAEVQVLSRNPSTAEQLIGVVRTDDQGRYSYSTPATSNRILRFLYHGTPLMLPTQMEVTLRVGAASTIRARPSKLVNGRVVTFTGRVRSLPTPPAGKLIELQVVLSGRWQTFRTTQTDQAGSWAVRYRFRRSCGLTRYRFRARLPAEEGYEFETRHTRAVRVRVRGAPCR